MILNWPILGGFPTHLHVVADREPASRCLPPDLLLEDLNLFWKQVVKSQAQRCFYNPPLPTRGCGWGQPRAVSPRGAGPRLLAGAHLASPCVSSHLVKELERLQPDVFHFVVSSLPASGLTGSPAAADHGGSVRWVGETCQSGWWYHPDCSQPGLPH